MCITYFHVLFLILTLYVCQSSQKDQNLPQKRITIVVTIVATQIATPCMH